jgi:hypothetical protein
MTDSRPGLPAGQVDEHLRGAQKAYRAAEERSVLWFGEVVRRKLYRELGLSSIHQYAGERLGFSAGKTAQFLRLAEALEELPGLRRSVASGEVPWTAAREVVRVATPGTEAAWLREARGSSRRTLERKIRASRSRARAARRRNPAQGGLALVRPGSAAPEADTSGDVPGEESHGIDPADVDVAAAGVPVDLSFRLSPLEYARYEALIEALRKAGEKGDRNEILLAALEALVIERRSSNSTTAVEGTDPTGSAVSRAGGPRGADRQPGGGDGDAPPTRP